MPTIRKRTDDNITACLGPTLGVRDIFQGLEDKNIGSQQAERQDESEKDRGENQVGPYITPAHLLLSFPGRNIRSRYILSRSRG
jgi:hypothetical protein